MAAAGHVWTSDEVAGALGVSSPAQLKFTAISTDTRHLTPGTLFVALKGEKFDAHNFLAQAKAQGGSRPSSGGERRLSMVFRTSKSMTR